MNRRSRTGFHVSSLVLAAALVASVPVAAGASVKNPTTITVVAATKAALAKTRGVHVSVETMLNKVVSSVVADIGQKSGTETYVEGDETFTISVTPMYAYLSGSKTGLTKLMGLSAAEQAKVGSSWIAMKEGSAPYTPFQSNLTTGAFANLMPPVKNTTLLAARSKTNGGYQIKWTEPASSSGPKSTTIMTISSGKKTLPIEEAVSTSNGNSTTKFSKWGETVHVAVPSSVIAYAKVFPAS